MNYELHLSISELKHLQNTVNGYADKVKNSQTALTVTGISSKIDLLLKYAKTEQQAQRLTRQAETRKRKYNDLVSGFPVKQPEQPPEPAKKPEPVKPDPTPTKQPGKKKPGEPVKRKRKKPEPVKELETEEIDFDRIDQELDID